MVSNITFVRRLAVQEIFAIWIGVPVTTEALVCARQWQELPLFHNSSEVHSDYEPTQGALYPLPLQREHLGDAGGFILLGPLLPVREMKLIMGDCRPDPEENLERNSAWRIRRWRGNGPCRCLAMGTAAADVPGVWAHVCGQGRE